MEKISMDKFKDNKLLIVVTVFFGILTSIYYFVMPEYYEGNELVFAGLFAFLVGYPIIGWWFQKVWNSILRKIFPLKEISYGVALLLSIIFGVLFSA